jgi:hypothetical protein
VQAFTGVARRRVRVDARGLVDDQQVVVFE